MAKLILWVHNIDKGNVNQEPQRIEEEQGRANIEDSDRVNKKIEHLADLIVTPLP